MPQKNWLVLGLMIAFMMITAACGDSGSVGDELTDGDSSDLPSGCDQCRPNELCVTVAGDYACAQICTENDDCPGEVCCQNQEGISYCVQEGTICGEVTCTADAQCPLDYVCQKPPGICVKDTSAGDDCTTDLDCDPGQVCVDGKCHIPSDGDVSDGDEDSDGDEEQEDLPPDPNMTYRNPCDFGAVPIGSTGTCTINLCNTGPENDASVVYNLDYPATSDEFWLDEDTELGEGEYVTIKVGECQDIPIQYTPFDPGKDFGSLEVIVTSEADTGINRFYIDLVTQEKGEIHAYTIPEEPTTPDDPSALEFGAVRLFTKKTLNLAVGNRMFDEADTVTMRAFDFRFEAAEDPTFIFEGDDEYFLAPGQEVEIPISCLPITKGEHYNKLIFRTNDPQHPTFQIPVTCDGVQPEVCTFPFTVDFGKVAFGECGTENIEICNCGGYELLVEGVRIDDATLQFGYIPPQVQFPILLLPEGEGLPGDDCFEMTVNFCPQERDLQEAFLIIDSDAPGDEEHKVQLQGEGVGPTLCTFPPNPMDYGRVQFGASIGDTVVTMNGQVWNCGPGEALLCCIDTVMGVETPEGTFSLRDFEPFMPTECGDDPNLENCLPLIGGDSPNYLNFKIDYQPTDYGRHNAITHFDAIAGYWDVGEYVEIKALATSCPEGTWDLDPLIPGCEYECTFIDAVDEPDLEFIDANCDGIDGMIDRAIFVSVDGNDRNEGTIDKPKKTLQSGIFAAIQDFTKDSVYISAGTYNKRLIMSSGVSVYGGYSRWEKGDHAPLGWDRSFDYEATVFGDYIGMVADGIGRRTKAQLFTVQSDDGNDDDVSSYGIYSRRADSLVLEAITVYSGNGRDGENGYSEGQPGRDGDSGERGQGGREDDSSWYCGHNGRPGVGLGGYSICGQRGGNGGYSCKTGGSKCAGFEGESGSCGVYGGNGYPAGPGSAGGAGDNGFDGSHGAGGLAEGNVVGGRWVPDAGENGTPGGDGCGGGGGGGGGSMHDDILFFGTCEDWGGTGGGGGGGGCGGSAGSGGAGGGTSFGLFLYDSSPEIFGCLFYAGSGGNGGDGRDGGRGGRGGDGGQGGANYNEGDFGGPGGSGGDGGKGGSGGGGAGGSSIGTYCAGNSQPIMMDNQVTLGDFGYGGGAGTWSGNEGEDGLALESVNCPQK